MSGNTKIMVSKEIQDGDGSAPTVLRYVRAIKASYVNGVLLEPGDVGTWPRGVKELGANLEEYFPGGKVSPLPVPPPPMTSPEGNNVPT